jgi:hypothetical protein
VPPNSLVIYEELNTKVIEKRRKEENDFQI